MDPDLRAPTTPPPSPQRVYGQANTPGRHFVFSPGAKENQGVYHVRRVADGTTVKVGRTSRALADRVNEQRTGDGDIARAVSASIGGDSDDALEVVVYGRAPLDAVCYAERTEGLVRAKEGLPTGPYGDGGGISAQQWQLRAATRTPVALEEMTRRDSEVLGPPRPSRFDPSITTPLKWYRAGRGRNGDIVLRLPKPVAEHEGGNYQFRVRDADTGRWTAVLVGVEEQPLQDRLRGYFDGRTFDELTATLVNTPHQISFGVTPLDRSVDPGQQEQDRIAALGDHLQLHNKTRGGNGGRRAIRPEEEAAALLVPRDHPSWKEFVEIPIMSSRAAEKVKAGKRKGVMAADSDDDTVYQRPKRSHPSAGTASGSRAEHGSDSDSDAGADSDSDSGSDNDSVYQPPEHGHPLVGVANDSGSGDDSGSDSTSSDEDFVGRFGLTLPPNRELFL